MDWCDRLFNAAMDQLGLPPISRRWHVVIEMDLRPDPMFGLGSEVALTEEFLRSKWTSDWFQHWELWMGEEGDSPKIPILVEVRDTPSPGVKTIKVAWDSGEMLRDETASDALVNSLYRMTSYRSPVQRFGDVRVLEQVRLPAVWPGSEEVEAYGASEG